MNAYRILRLVVALGIVAGIVFAAIIEPIFTVLILGTLILLFTQTSIPYYAIGYVFRFITKARYVCVTVPFQNKFITIRDKNYKGSISPSIIAHENDHIAWFANKGEYIGSIIFIVLLIWYGYYNHPVEVRARKAETK